ncbi:hypothetical protein SUGI_0238540 [Cryptomeria japonica]|nr:hypothetical protein SUGI_0238540 [Cryptomeria japonica]
MAFESVGRGSGCRVLEDVEEEDGDGEVDGTGSMCWFTMGFFLILVSHGYFEFGMSREPISSWAPSLPCGPMVFFLSLGCLYGSLSFLFCGQFENYGVVGTSVSCGLGVPSPVHFIHLDRCLSSLRWWVSLLFFGLSGFGMHCSYFFLLGPFFQASLCFCLHVRWLMEVVSGENFVMLLWGYCFGPPPLHWVPRSVLCFPPLGFHGEVFYVALVLLVVWMHRANGLLPPPPFPALVVGSFPRLVVLC